MEQYSLPHRHTAFLSTTRSLKSFMEGLCHALYGRLHLALLLAAVSVLPVQTTFEGLAG